MTKSAVARWTLFAAAPAAQPAVIESLREMVLSTRNSTRASSAFTPGTGGGTDAGDAGRSGQAAVLESPGLAGWGYHARNEYIEIDSIVPRLYLTTRLLSDLARG